MNIHAILSRSPVIPVVRIQHTAYAVPMARALVAGGLHVIEITLRTPVALEASAAIAKEVPEATLGVGTITRTEQFEQARAAGASFAVSPGFTPELAAAAQASHLAFLPGVMTPSDVLRAVDAGFGALKLFPAAQAGGVDMIKALSGPFPGLNFCPTGGVSPDNLTSYLALANVPCVGGSWVTPQSAMDNGDWDSITELAAEALRLAPSSGNPEDSSESTIAPDDDAALHSAVGEEDPGADF